MAKKQTKIIVQGVEISISEIDKQEYICITDMAKAKKGDQRAADVIKNWIRNRGTIEFFPKRSAVLRHVGITLEFKLVYQLLF